MQRKNIDLRMRFMRTARRTFATGSTIIVIWQFSGVQAPPGRAADAVSRHQIDGHKSMPGPQMEFQATAYCESGITSSGVQAAPGLAAADISVLPLGSLVHVEGKRHRGIYRVMDTGRLVKGRIIDIYMSDLQRAVTFGRQKVVVTVLQYGTPARAGIRRGSYSD